MFNQLPMQSMCLSLICSLAENTSKLKDEHNLLTYEDSNSIFFAKKIFNSSDKKIFSRRRNIR